MLIVLLASGIAIVAVAVIYEFWKERRRSREFRKLVTAAGVEGKWAEILDQAYKTFPATEVQRLEDALRARARPTMREAEKDQT